MKLILSPKEKSSGSGGDTTPGPESFPSFPGTQHSSSVPNPLSSSLPSTPGLMPSSTTSSSSSVKKSSGKKEKDRERGSQPKASKKKQQQVPEPLPVVGKEVEVEGEPLFCMFFLFARFRLYFTGQMKVETGNEWQKEMG